MRDSDRTCIFQQNGYGYDWLNSQKFCLVLVMSFPIQRVHGII